MLQNENAENEENTAVLFGVTRRRKAAEACVENLKKKLKVVSYNWTNDLQLRHH